MLSKKSIGILLAVVMLLTVSMSGFAVQASGLEPNHRGTVKIIMKDHSTGEDIKGGEFAIYQVATIRQEDADLSYELTGTFVESKKDLTTLDNPGLAEDLVKFAEIPNAKAEPKDGSVIFTDLEQGLYLVVQTKASEGYLPAKSFLVSVPVKDGEEWVYDVDATPKTEIEPEEKAPVELAVKKVWADKGKKHPTSVTAGLYEGDKLVEKVILSDKNNWTHTWKDLDGNKKWDVKEINVPKGYKVSYQKSEMLITMTNTSGLIQTGQWNWPVPVLAFTGLVLILIGFMLLNSKRKTR